MINAAREMKELPDINALMKKKLSGAKNTPSATPGETTSSGPLSLVIPQALTTDPVNTESLREEPVQESSDRETAEPSVTDGNKKKRFDRLLRSRLVLGQNPMNLQRRRRRKRRRRRRGLLRSDRSPAETWRGRELVALDSSNRNVAAQTSDELDDSPSIPLERKKKSTREGDAPTSVEKSPPAAPSATRSSGSASKGGRIKFPDHVEFKYDGDTPLAYAPTECAELVRQIRGGAKDIPLVKDLIFKDAYVDAARTKILVRITFLVSPSLRF